MKPFSNANWICSELFKDTEPIDVYKKEHSDKEIIKHDLKYKNNHMLVRKVFFIDNSFESALIRITADDYYKLYINGAFIGSGPAQSYNFSYNYNTYDITNYLTQAENTIAVNVFYQGEINRAYNSGDLLQGMTAELSLDGKQCVYTDSSWKYMTAREFNSKETIAYDTQFVDDIDARLKIYGWKDAGFDDTAWNMCRVKDDDTHKLVPQITPPLEYYIAYPEAVLYRDDTRIVFDFGTEHVGCLNFAAKGKEGQNLTVRCGEELLSDSPPSVRYDMRCSTKYEDTFILSGKCDAFEPFEYKAFRYAEICGDISSVDTESIKIHGRHYPYDEDNCSFSSSDTLLNSIWNICERSVVLGAQEVFVDCPQREKGQYLGDATITAPAHLYLSGDSLLYRKALYDFANSSFICPGLMSVAPGSLMQEIADYSFQYPQQLLGYYMYTGDIETLAALYKYAKDCINYFAKYRRTDGLLENITDKWNLVDWPQNLRDGYDFDLSKPVGRGCHNVINAFYIGGMQALYKIQDILNIPHEDELPQLISAYNKAFYRKDTGLYADSDVSQHSSLHSNALAMYFEIPDKAKGKHIAQFIKNKGFSCGVYMAYFVLKGLVRYGEYDLAYSLITSDDTNSWQTMVKEGASCCFEAWGKDLKDNTSLCHPWASAPIIVMIEDIIGLTPKTAGWKEINFEPHIPDSLESFTLKLNLDGKAVTVSRKNGKTTIN